ncbi:uncharacterized protein [Musca autumnalis]|uniref:uncharacterized protein n=1 Tax=Musca autumnalis TaxID=221902 RepID=UPI003CF4042E
MNQPLEDVSSFNYLGSIITTNGGSDKDIQCRLNKAAFGMLNKLWRDRSLSSGTKLKVFNSNVKSVMFYGCETWMIPKNLMRSMQAFTNRCLRRIYGIYWPNTLTNNALWNMSNQQPLEAEIKRKKYR